MTDDLLRITDDLADAWVDESMRVNGHQRSGSGWCCEYHNGFEDALGWVISWQERQLPKPHRSGRPAGKVRGKGRPGKA